MNRSPQLARCAGEVKTWALQGESLSYPLGANGFVFRRTDLESMGAKEHSQNTHIVLHLMHAGKRQWIRNRGRGVHHYYVQTLWGFVQKRQRAMAHFLRVQQEMPVNWMRDKPAVPIWPTALYCVTLIGPLWHTFMGVAWGRDSCWL